MVQVGNDNLRLQGTGGGGVNIGSIQLSLGVFLVRIYAVHGGGLRVEVWSRWFRRVAVSLRAFFLFIRYARIFKD